MIDNLHVMSRAACAMTMYFKVRDPETDTLNETVFGGSTPSYDDAIDDAKRWAAEYYGSRGTTWSTLYGDESYLVGCLHENGDRKLVTCVITVEGKEIDDEDGY